MICYYLKWTRCNLLWNQSYNVSLVALVAFTSIYNRNIYEFLFHSCINMRRNDLIDILHFQWFNLKCASISIESTRNQPSIFWIDQNDASTKFSHFIEFYSISTRVWCVCVHEPRHQPERQVALVLFDLSNGMK